MTFWNSFSSYIIVILHVIKPSTLQLYFLFLLPRCCKRWTLCRGKNVKMTSSLYTIARFDYINEMKNCIILSKGMRYNCIPFCLPAIKRRLFCHNVEISKLKIDYYVDTTNLPDNYFTLDDIFPWRKMFHYTSRGTDLG